MALFDDAARAAALAQIQSIMNRCRDMAETLLLADVHTRVQTELSFAAEHLQAATFLLRGLSRRGVHPSS